MPDTACSITNSTLQQGALCLILISRSTNSSINFLVPGAEELQVSPDAVREVSPRYTPPAPHIPVIVAVGARETSEWIRQTDETVAVLEAQGSTLSYLKPEYDQHFPILFSLGNPMTELCSKMLAQMGLR